ncbi:hypothetical protein CHARACLAT_017568 [Characodon lateralis]|uniref:Uncharacterized protein n=1 Tax=Characodon lateralis TaxID=208331 RepID=A0ABU7DRX8_9TELE|nr:hypothetical protein [Characodon lateralis]
MDMPIPVHFPLASVEEVESFEDRDKDSVHSLKQSLVYLCSAQNLLCFHGPSSSRGSGNRLTRTQQRLQIIEGIETQIMR